MSVLRSLLIIAIAGGVGGLLHSFLVDNTLGKRKEGFSGWILALMFNILIGAAASAMSWGLYGPLNSYPILGALPEGNTPPAMALTLSVLASAVMIGVGGPRWLQSEVDKRLLQEAASTAASKHPDNGTSQKMLTATALEVRELARNMAP